MISNFVLLQNLLELNLSTENSEIIKILITASLGLFMLSRQLFDVQYRSTISIINIAYILSKEREPIRIKPLIAGRC